MILETFPLRKGNLSLDVVTLGMKESEILAFILTMNVEVERPGRVGRLGMHM
jgi:hypothetical protein